MCVCVSVYSGEQYTYVEERLVAHISIYFHVQGDTAEKVLLNVLLSVPPVTVAAQQLS